jgi:hypothetical protein
LSILFVVVNLSSLLVYARDGNNPKRKKDIRDYTEVEIDRLYDEWEKNDEDVLDDDEKPDYMRPKQDVDFEAIKEMVALKNTFK